ncbi:MAG: 8-oxo-dGTP diphosphatase [Clostridia bacterium]|nr:8-oxo-dGTP diphosphatase [Clostridia bacterium]MBQ5649175.1 8-oxo-dGTP diphosphatase [Clostridia bacterium]MBR0327655.1 8-oxo-dGTP diphosphatase [Clostridia bacterium]
MIRSTLCYIERDGKYLMLHRIKKHEDVNAGKWIGIGGKLEDGETPDECLVREVREETGLTLTDYRFCGEVYFLNDVYPDELMYLYTATGFCGELTECNEGVLCWVDKDKVSTLPMWEGDKVFFALMEEMKAPFKLTLNYSGDMLLSHNVEDMNI